MALKITKAAEPIHVDRLKVVIYAAPGLGKSSIAFTADAPLLLDFDRGSYRAANRKDVVQIEQWSDAAGITAEDLAPYKTVIIDTAGRALDMLTVDIIKANARMGNGGALSQPGWGQLKSRFGAYLNLLTSFGLDVVLVAHMEEKQQGDEIKERLDVQGGSKGEIYKSADAMGRVTIENGQRWLKFSPTEAAYGKNPGQLEALAVPAQDSPEFAGFLARVIQRTKDKINELSADQLAAKAEQDWFRENLPKVTDAAGINALIDRAKKADKACVMLMHARAVEIGLVGDKATGTYIAKPTETAPAESATAEPQQQPKAA
jgi:hypothetical protein